MTHGSHDPINENTPWRLAEGPSGYGCHVNPIPKGCLSCPLARCLYDFKRPEVAFKRIQRQPFERAVLSALATGRGVDHIAGNFGISPRTVYRIKERAGRVA